MAQPRAQGDADDMPLLPALVAVVVVVALVLLSMNVWGLYEFLGLARRRAGAFLAGTAAVVTGLASRLQFAPFGAGGIGRDEGRRLCLLRLAGGARFLFTLQELSAA
jgi:hypothetical protein